MITNAEIGVETTTLASDPAVVREFFSHEYNVRVYDAQGFEVWEYESDTIVPVEIGDMILVLRQNIHACVNVSLRKIENITHDVEHDGPVVLHLSDEIDCRHFPEIKEDVRLFWTR